MGEWKDRGREKNGEEGRDEMEVKKDLDAKLSQRRITKDENETEL